MSNIDYQAAAQAAILDMVGVAVIVADRGGVVREWSTGAQRMFGHTTQEAVGQTLDLIIPERLRERHWEGWGAAIARGSTRYGDRTLAVPGIRGDGSRISVEFTIGLVRGEDGAIAAVAAVMHDVTERFERDRAQRRRLTELERQVELLQTTGTPSASS